MENKSSQWLLSPFKRALYGGRSLLFYIMWIMWTVISSILFIPILCLPYGNYSRFAPYLWSKISVLLLKYCCGIRYQVQGLEHIPHTRPFIVAAKHQSPWETMFFSVLWPEASYVLKRELTYIPIFGWYLRKMQMIAIDRSSGTKALRQLIHETNERLAAKRVVVIFPEGTRVDPFIALAPLHPGIAATYSQQHVPVVPVLLNSGLCWRRDHWLKYPGLITVRILPVIDPGLNRGDFMQALSAKIEKGMVELLHESNLDKSL
jgi:1-acyl-sn-glycerol-3-phosphate acyltransferase